MVLFVKFQEMSDFILVCIGVLVALALIVVLAEVNNQLDVVIKDVVNLPVFFLDFGSVGDDVLPVGIRQYRVLSQAFHISKSERGVKRGHSILDSGPMQINSIGFRSQWYGSSRNTSNP